MSITTHLAREMHDGVFVRSVYFQDPYGILLYLAALTKARIHSSA